MNNKTTVYIGLGSNMAEPAKQIDAAIRKIVNRDEFAMVLTSSYYNSAPLGYEHQDDFINCVVRADTAFSADELLDFLQSIENEAGRERDPKNQNAPRPIDCDILLYASDEIETNTLVVPHPRMTERLFVMEPLVELSKGLDIPGKGSVATLLDDLKNSPAGKMQSITKL